MTASSFFPIQQEVSHESPLKLMHPRYYNLHHSHIRNWLRYESEMAIVDGFFRRFMKILLPIIQMVRLYRNSSIKTGHDWFIYNFDAWLKIRHYYVTIGKQEQKWTNLLQFLLSKARVTTNVLLFRAAFLINIPF